MYIPLNIEIEVIFLGLMPDLFTKAPAMFDFDRLKSYNDKLGGCTRQELRFDN